ncbi:hypothetical protein ACFTWS_38675 [Streptomyces sp. NPDC057027]
MTVTVRGILNPTRSDRGMLEFLRRVGLKNADEPIDDPCRVE